MVVYKATNLINAKRYIGQTTCSLNSRKQKHFSTSKIRCRLYFHKALRKYGKDHFVWEVIRICGNIDELNAWEQYYILYYDSMRWGYNLESGGKNCITSEETKKKIKEKHADFSGKKHWFYGKHFSDEHKKKIGNANRGRKATKAQRLVMSKIMKKRWTNPAFRAKMLEVSKNKVMPEESKEKLRQIALGRKLTEETKKKISKARMGMKFTNKHRENLSVAARKRWGKKEEKEIKSEI